MIRLVALVLVLALAGACGGAGDGTAAPATAVRPSPPPPASPAASPASATPATPASPAVSAEPPPASAPPSTAASGPFRLTSPAFADGAPIPDAFSCHGADVSPPLAWTGTPAGTAGFALLVDDPDAGGFVHWVVGPIPPDRTSLPRNVGPRDLPQGENGFGSTGWRGPCPPSGVHRYVFRLVALAPGTDLPEPPTAAAVRRALDAAPETGKLVGTYAAP